MKCIAERDCFSFKHQLCPSTSQTLQISLSLLCHFDVLLQICTVGYMPVLNRMECRHCSHANSYVRRVWTERKDEHNYSGALCVLLLLYRPLQSYSVCGVKIVLSDLIQSSMFLNVLRKCDFCWLNFTKHMSGSRFTLKLRI